HGSINLPAARWRPTTFSRQRWKALRQHRKCRRLPRHRLCWKLWRTASRQRVDGVVATFAVSSTKVRNWHEAVIDQDADEPPELAQLARACRRQGAKGVPPGAGLRPGTKR